MLSPTQARVVSEDPVKTNNDMIERTRASLQDTFKRRQTAAPVAHVEPEAPAVVEPPAEPAATPAPVAAEPAPPSAPAPAPEPAAPAKIKIGEKEYTIEELQAQQAELDRLKQAATPAATTPAPAPTAEPPKPPTEEEIKAAEAAWMTDTAATLDAPITEEQLNEILDGGPKAVAALGNIRKQDMARTLLTARKGIMAQLNPILTEVFETLKPLVAQFENVQRYNVQAQFKTKHPHFEPHLGFCTEVAESLLKQYPQECQKLSTEQFIDEVARQSDRLLTAHFKRFNPNGNWRDAAKTPAPAAAPAPAPAPVSAAPAATAPVTTPAAPAPAPAPAAPPKPTLRPLAGNAPAAPIHASSSWQAQQAAAVIGRR